MNIQLNINQQSDLRSKLRMFKSENKICPKTANVRVNNECFSLKTGNIQKLRMSK